MNKFALNLYRHVAKALQAMSEIRSHRTYSTFCNAEQVCFKEKPVHIFSCIFDQIVVNIQLLQTQTFSREAAADVCISLTNMI